MQDVFRFCAAIFFAYEAVDITKPSNKTLSFLQECRWWNCLETTRYLIGHMLFKLEPGALAAIAKNMCCLYALVGIRLDDPSQRYRGSFINTASPRFMLRGSKARKPSNIWVPPSKPYMESLSYASESEISASFATPAPNHAVAEDLRRIKNTFGQAVYQLVATNKTEWRSSNKQYIKLKRYKSYNAVAGAPLCQLAGCKLMSSTFTLVAIQHAFKLLCNWLMLACLSPSVFSSHAQV